jgi:hypothetical protein
MDVAANDAPRTKAKQMTAAPRMCLPPDIAMIFCHRRSKEGDPSMARKRQYRGFTVAPRTESEVHDLANTPSSRVAQHYLDLCANDTYS